MTVSPLLQAKDLKDEVSTSMETNEFKIWNLTMLQLHSLVTARTYIISVLFKKCPTPPIYVAGQQVTISRDDSRQDLSDCILEPPGPNLVQDFIYKGNVWWALGDDGNVK